jgi:hypothetical protein
VEQHRTGNLYNIMISSVDLIDGVFDVVLHTRLLVERSGIFGLDSRNTKPVRIQKFSLFTLCYGKRGKKCLIPNHLLK